MNILELEGRVNLRGVPEETITTIAMEECAELIQAISKNVRMKGDYENTCEEVADVLICISWIKKLYELKTEDIQKWLDFKINRCNAKIQEGKFY